MTESFKPEDFEPEVAPRKGGTIANLPSRDASFSVLRQWVSNAIGLPSAVKVDTVTRFGRDEDDALVLTLSNDTVLRCGRQKRLQQPASFRAWLASESDGLCRPPHFKPAEVGDIYVALCALATAAVEQDEMSELVERLQGFVSMCEVVHSSLTPEYRYETLRRLQKRDEYDRTAAAEGKKGRTTVRPVLVADHVWQTYLVRHSEFITQLRVVHMQTVPDMWLKGRMAELGCEYHAVQAHGPGRRGHASMTFYQLAPELSVPHNADG